MIKFFQVQVRSLGSDIAFGAEGLGFVPWAGKIGHSIASNSPPLRYFLKVRSCIVLALSRRDGEMGPAARYTLLRNTASIMKI